MQDNRPSVYSEGDSIIYRASAIGHCLRQLWAARSGLERRPFPLVVQRGMDEGTSLEPIILNLLFEKYHWTFQDGSQSVVELNLGAWNGKTLIVRGALDEIGCPYNPDLPRESQPFKPVDVKAFTEDYVNTYLTRGIAAFPAYAWQQSVYDHAYGDGGYFMPIFHKGTWEMVEQSLVPQQALYSVEQIQDRVLQIEEAYTENKMPEECPNDYACPYFYLHEQKPVDELPDDSLPLVSARIKVAQKEATFKSAKAALDEKLKTLLFQDVTYHHDGYSIAVFQNPRKFNTDQAKAILKDADIDWENDDLFWTPGKGIQIRFNPPKKAKADE